MDVSNASQGAKFSVPTVRSLVTPESAASSLQLNLRIHTTTNPAVHPSMMPALAPVANLPAMLVGVVPTVSEVLAVPLMRMASMAVVVVVAGKFRMVVDIRTESC